MTPGYLRTFELSLVPFSKEVPDDELWLPPSKQSTVDDIIEALHERASITISGEPGVGKTSVLRAIKHQRKRPRKAGWRE